MRSGIVQDSIADPSDCPKPLHKANVGIWTEKTSEVAAKVDDVEHISLSLY